MWHNAGTMKRLSVLALSVVCLGGMGILSSLPASASGEKTLTLMGMVEGLETDGAFPANVVLKDPKTRNVLYSGSTRFDIQDGAYTADLSAVDLGKASDVLVEIEGLDAAEEFSMAGFVNLQDVTPGAAQTGHLNISGYVLAGRIGLGVSPTLARVQVNETGSIQGVRSITGTGTAVYGQATAGTGLAAGGYFTTNSVGGRAMVGDALSTTGSTVGGLFYNRSQAGVAVWGRHVNGAGASIGVFGQTASSAGTAMMAENTGTGDTAELAGANGTLLTTGTLPKHQYTSGVAASMVPIAYGLVLGSGGVFTAGSGNWTCTRNSVGNYTLNISGVPSPGGVVLLADAIQSGGGEFASVSDSSSSSYDVFTYSVPGAGLIDSAFTFVAYAAASFDPPLLPHGQGGSEGRLSKSSVQSFEAYRRANLKAQKDAMKVIPTEIPVDEAETAGRPGAVIRPKK